MPEKSSAPTVQELAALPENEFLELCRDATMILLCYGWLLSSGQVHLGEADRAVNDRVQALEQGVQAVLHWAGLQVPREAVKLVREVAQGRKEGLFHGAPCWGHGGPLGWLGKGWLLVALRADDFEGALHQCLAKGDKEIHGLFMAEVLGDREGRKA